MARLIDTSIFVAAEREGLDLAALVADEGDEAIALSAVTASELLVGVHRAESESRRTSRAAFVEGLLVHFRVVPFTLDVSRTHAEIRAKMLRDGVTIGAHDLLIAATAIHHRYGVATRDLRDFPRVPGLDVVRW